MDIYSKINGDEPKKVYEAKISSSGSCGMLNEVIDEIIAALFLDFPGNSGSSETIEIIQEAEFSCWYKQLLITDTAKYESVPGSHFPFDVPASKLQFLDIRLVIPTAKTYTTNPIPR